MIRNYVCFRDYETGSRNRYKTQPLQLAAVMIDLPRLEVVKDSVFDSLIKPEEDPEICASLNIDEIQDEALKVNKLDLNDLRKAPAPKVVWENYLDYLKDYNLKGKDGGKWDAPIIGGFNNRNFDDQIDIRMCQQYGPALDDYGGWTLYHPVFNFDVFSDVFKVLHNYKLTKNGRYSQDACREHFGYKTEGAHNAKIDVLQGADMLLRFLKLYRNMVSGEIDLPKGKRIQFKNCVGGKL